MKGWSQEGEVEFFWTEVENLCGGSSICMTHTGFMLPADTTDTDHVLKQRASLRRFTGNTQGKIMSQGPVGIKDELGR